MGDPNTREIDVTPAANATKISAPTAGGDGYVTKVQISCPSVNPPRGRYYGRLAVMKDNLTTNATLTRFRSVMTAILWAGYVTNDQSVSIPNYKLRASEWLQLVVTGGSNGSTGDTIRASIEIEDRPVTGAQIFVEPPGSGPGEFFTVVDAAPAAGANPASNSVPAVVRQRLRSINVGLTTGAAAGNRRVVVQMADASGTQFAQAPSGEAQPASTTTTYNPAIGGSSTHTNDSAGVASEFDQFALPDLILAASYTWQVVAQGIAAADAFTATNGSVEEWAIPNP